MPVWRSPFAVASRDMAENTWMDLEMPMLEEIERADSSGSQSAHDSGTLVDAIGTEADRVDRAVELLIEDDYVSGIDVTSVGDSRQQFIGIKLRPKGVRAIGRWPSADPFESLVGVLEQRIREVDDPKEKERLQGLLTSLKDVGKGVATAILTELIKQQAGL